MSKEQSTTHATKSQADGGPVPGCFPITSRWECLISTAHATKSQADGGPVDVMTETTLDGYRGILIREYFAARMMAALIVADETAAWDFAVLSVRAVHAADSLIAALAKGTIE